MAKILTQFPSKYRPFTDPLAKNKSTDFYDPKVKKGLLIQTHMGTLLDTIKKNVTRETCLKSKLTLFKAPYICWLVGIDGSWMATNINKVAVFLKIKNILPKKSSLKNKEKISVL